MPISSNKSSDNHDGSDKEIQRGDKPQNKTEGPYDELNPNTPSQFVVFAELRGEARQRLLKRTSNSNREYILKIYLISFEFIS